MRRWSAVLAAVAVCSFATGASAQEHDGAWRIDHLHPSSAGSPFIRAEGPHERFEKGIAFGARLVGDYQLAPVRTALIEEGQKAGDVDADIKPVAHAALIHVGASLSPIYWLNIEFNFPFAVFETGDADARARKNIQPGEIGIGDPRIGAHFRVMSSRKLDLAIGARVWAPLGQRRAYLGSGDAKFIRVELTPSIAGELDYFLYGCTLGIAPMWFAGGDGQRMAASCAAHFEVSKLVTLGIEPHVAAFTYAPAPVGGESVKRAAPGLGNANIAIQFEPMGVATFRIGDFSLSFAGGVGLGGAPGTPTARAVMSLSYWKRGEAVVPDPGEKDTDLDGVPDGYDACPKQAGPKDRRGCPDKLDADGDGIVKGDACPNEPGARYDDAKANGCPDRDNDHIADPIDPCPKQPGEGTGGCPEFAKLKKGQFVVNPPITFVRGGTKLTDIGRATFIEIIRTLRANPKLKQLSISVGTKRASTKLTDKRAKTLLTLFGEQNVDDSRFEVVLDDKMKSGDVKVRVVK